MKILNSLLFTLSLLHSIVLQAALNSAPAPPQIAAQAYMLKDFQSNQEIMAKNVDERLEPASLTKLMTAYLVFQKLKTGKIKLTDTVQISEKAWRMPGSRMYIEVGTLVTVDDLLKGMIIQSGNDASVALAEFIGGSEEAFVSLMNEQAQHLGLNQTHYMNSTGLPDDKHYSTVRDLASMAQILIRDFEKDYYPLYSINEFTYNNITQANRNSLLRRDPSVDGLKTGYTEAAGYCLIASAKRDNMRLISVVMGTKNEQNRLKESEKMIDYGFRFFKTYRLYEAKVPLDTVRVWYGHINQLQIGLKDPLYITVPNGQYQHLKANLYLDKYIMAPISAGKAYGTLKISLDNTVISERPVVALSSIQTGQLWKRLIDSFFRLFY